MIREQVKKTIEEKALIKKGDKVLACVSGGPDSMAMLHIMNSVRKSHRFDIAVAHLDHMLRGRQSAGDAVFVEKEAARLNVLFVKEQADVKAIAASKKISIEEAARLARYDFYERAAKKTGAKKIATAHTMDDQAETVLMRLIKGSGSLGLSGIPYKRRLGNAYVIRPMLDIKRRDIERYLKRHKIPSRSDATNLEMFYLRNKIRHRLIPLIEREYNPKIKYNLNLIAKTLNGEFNYLNEAALRLYNRLARKTKSGIKIRISSLIRQHIALQRLLVRHAIYALKGNLRRIVFRHWEEIEEMLGDQKKSGLDLPGGLKVARDKGYLVFTQKKSGVERRAGFKKILKLKIPGAVIIPELKIKVSSEIIKSAPRFRRGQRRNSAEFIDGDALGTVLKIRTRREGDRIRPLGMHTYKKLHDIFVDEKVPRELRDKIPLILSKNKIIWVAGLKLSDDVRIRKDTRRVVKIAAKPLAKK